MAIEAGKPGQARLMRVEVAYACPDEQVIVALDVPAGTTILQAVEQSRLLERFPWIDATRLSCGVFGQARRLDEPVRKGDRVEIYRPLRADPKSIRRRRARTPT